MKEEKMNINNEPQTADNKSLPDLICELYGLGAGKYKTIVVDPPWKYGVWGSGSKNALIQGEANKPQPLPYNYMSIEEIKALPVGSLANNDCELYLWVTQRYLPISFEIIKRWGFEYKQILTWCKKPMGKGQGGVYTPTTEFLILARKGKMPKVERIDTTWFQVKRTNKHSKKPEFFQDLIETVSKQPRIELFARRSREGWDVMGFEIDGKSIQDSINLIAQHK